MGLKANKHPSSTSRGQLCLVCQLGTRGTTVEVHLGYGISLWLCAEHASEDFRSMRSGRDFAATIGRAWSAGNCLTRNRRRALTAHLNRLREHPRRPQRHRPGSYNWKALRNELEHRAAAGESFASIVQDLRDRHRHDVADLPSESTMRRWYRERRWERGERTPLRAGFERRDLAHASRAQRERAPIRRLREAYRGGQRAVSAAVPARSGTGQRARRRE